MDFAALGVIVFKALLPVGLAAGSYLAAQAATWLNAHATNVAAKTALAILDDLVTTVVKELELTVVPGLKAKLEGGTLTLADGLAVKQQAINIIMGYIKQKGLDVVTKGLGMEATAMQQLVSSKVEKAVYDMKFPDQQGLPQFTAAPASTGAPIAGSPGAMNYKS